MSDEAIKCPLCAEEIRADSNVCPYCGARFQVMTTGYCAQCHAVVDADESGRCRQCGGEVIDRRVQSALVEEPASPPAQPSPTTPPPRKGRGWLWAFLLVVLLLCCGGLIACGSVLGVALGLGGGNLPPAASLLATATPTPRPTRVSPPTAVPMPTVPPAPTVASVPTRPPSPAARPTRTPSPTATRRPPTPTVPRPTSTPAATTIPGTGTVQGRILWNSQPFGGVTVKLCSDWHMLGGCKGVEYQAVSGADGRYRFEGVTPGKYDFVTKIPGQTTETMWLSVSVDVQAGRTVTVRDMNVIKYDLQLASPGDKATVSTRTPTLTWAAYPGAAYYKVYLVNAKSYKAVVSYEKVTGTQYATRTALEPVEHYWKINAYNANGIQIAESQGYRYFTVVGP